MDNNRNMILAIVLSALVLFGWSALSEKYFPTANEPVTAAESAPGASAPVPGGDPNAPTVKRARGVVLAESPRVKIETPALQGSINLKGARIDDLTLTSHRETLAKDAPPIRLLSPGGAPESYYAGFGWTGDGVATPNAETIWTADRETLTPATPVKLTWDNGQGQQFALTISVDEKYMFTVQQTVTNTGAGAVAPTPFGFLSREGVSQDPDSWTIHTGPLIVANGAANYDIDYDDLDAAGNAGIQTASKGGWLGFTDKYWQSALIPDQRANVNATFRTSSDKGSYQADFTGTPTVVAPGKASTVTARFFAGAKEVALLDTYEKDLGIAHFDRAIDWGWFYWFEKPIFYLLDWLFRMVGNFGVAIICLTIIIRLLMFPIAQKQFASMAGMRVVQPKMKALQERYKDDKQRLQQEMLKLYKEEKVNPLAGCLPILLQIPIFYALYKVLLLTVEMRHQPFVLWIKDLSAPDPLTPVNLFGLLSFTPPSFIALGILPILLGITMWLQFKLNPAPTDPVQAQVFAFMPWIFMFIMAPFAAGLQLYWVTNNILTIGQQKWLYSRHPGLKEAPAK